LKLDLGEWIFRFRGGQGLRHVRDRVPRGGAGPARQTLPQYDGGASAAAGLDLEIVHQTPGAYDAHAHPRGRSITAFQDSVQIFDAGPGVRNANDQGFGKGVAFDGIIYGVYDFAAARVTEGVAGDLGDGGRDTGLILRVESREACDLTRALAGGDGVVFVTNVESEDRNCRASCAFHYAVYLATTMVASSLPRAKSR
jgi:hypothetical protein